MSVVNGLALQVNPPIREMLTEKFRDKAGGSFGLTEVGYDIRLKQEVRFQRRGPGQGMHHRVWDKEGGAFGRGRFCIASAKEEFDMPHDMVGIVHDKSTWARKGLSVFNTVIEPGWRGFLTLELVYHGNDDLVIPMGTGIAQVVFHRLSNEAAYSGGYQDQADRPVGSILDKI